MLSVHILRVVLLVMFSAAVRCEGTCDVNVQTIDYSKLAKNYVAAQIRNSKPNADIEYISANKIGKGKWSGLDHCPPNTWVHTVDAASWYDNSTARGTNYLSHLAIEFCHEQPGAPPNSLLIGLYFETERVPVYKGRVALRAYYLCGHQSSVFIPKALAPSSWYSVVCKQGRAICALEGQYDSFGGHIFLSDVRIGCCLVPDHLRQKSVPPYDESKFILSNFFLDFENDPDYLYENGEK